MADNKDTMSRRDQHLERLRSKYPEKKFEDDEEIFGQISDDYDQFEEENTAMKERERSLSEMFRTDPRSAFFLNDMREGKDPVMGLVSRFGIEVKDVLDDPEKQEELKRANEEYIERVAQNRKLEEEYDRNMDSTLKTLTDYQKGNGLTDDEIDTICAAWLQIVREGVMGKLTTETISLIANALNHDTDVETAREEGNVAGKNTKIVEKIRRPKQGDGIETLNGRNGRPMSGSGRKSIFDLARDAE